MKGKSGTGLKGRKKNEGIINRYKQSYYQGKSKTQAKIMRKRKDSKLETSKTMEARCGIILELKGEQETVTQQLKLYTHDAKQIEKEKKKEEIIQYWKKIYRKHENDIAEKFNEEGKFTKKSMKNQKKISTKN